MRPKGQARKKKTMLPEGLEKRLSVYALAAAAGGVGMLAMAVPAQANDITLVTEDPVFTSEPTGINFLVFSSPQALEFTNMFTVNSKGAQASVYVRAVNGAAVMESGVGVARLGYGVTIGPSAYFGNPFFNPPQLIASAFLTLGKAYYGSNGNWLNTSGYLGFKFLNSAGSKSYFGWAHMSVSGSALLGEHVSISEYAYDNVAGQSIKAGQTAVPEPGTLALLAMGALGLFALRRKKLAGSN